MRETRSRDEIEEAIRTFSTADWSRLKKCANIYSRPWLSSEDLLQEAFCRALEYDRRKCPVDVNVVRFLIGAMRSIVSSEQERVGNKPILDSVSIDDYPSEAMNKLPDANETDDLFRTEIMSIFEDDHLARDILDGLMEGMKASEICELTDLDKKSYNSKRRLIRRRIDKRYPNGWEL